MVFENILMTKILKSFVSLWRTCIIVSASYPHFDVSSKGLQRSEELYPNVHVIYYKRRASYHLSNLYVQYATQVKFDA